MSTGTHKVGFECEIDDPKATPDLFAQPLIDAGLWSLPSNEDPYWSRYYDRQIRNSEPIVRDHRTVARAHPPHCACTACAWGASLVRPQSDCTCSAELVSDPLPWPNPNTEAVLTQFCDVLGALGIKPGVRAGCHLHVQKTDAEVNQVLAWFAYYEPSFADYARQSFPGVRLYNMWLSGMERQPIPAPKRMPSERAGTNQYNFPIRRTPEQHHTHVKQRMYDFQMGKGPTLSDRGTTWEFRIWNSVVSDWRLHMAIEISCAFLDAVAEAGPFPTEHLPPSKTLVEFLAPYLSPVGLGYMARHLADAIDVDASLTRQEGLL